MRGESTPVHAACGPGEPRQRRPGKAPGPARRPPGEDAAGPGQRGGSGDGGMRGSVSGGLSIPSSPRPHCWLTEQHRGSLDVPMSRRGHGGLDTRRCLGRCCAARGRTETPGVSRDPRQLRPGWV